MTCEDKKKSPRFSESGRFFLTKYSLENGAFMGISEGVHSDIPIGTFADLLQLCQGLKPWQSSIFLKFTDNKFAGDDDLTPNPSPRGEGSLNFVKINSIRKISSFNGNLPASKVYAPYFFAQHVKYLQLM